MIDVVEDSVSGGQKQVFPCSIEGRKYALKVIAVSRDDASELEELESETQIDEFSARAQREFAILAQCKSPHLVKLGPTGFLTKTIDGQHVVCFTEEWVSGPTLAATVADHALDLDGARALASQLTDAIEELWSHRHIHRDIKPQNIICRGDNDFVLLDMGIAFDVDATELTIPGFVPHTKGYTSPEQIDTSQKRQLNFRSDMFVVGIVLYEATTQRHPFSPRQRSTADAFRSILFDMPSPPSHYSKNLTLGFNRFVMRLLSKQPHMRYRTFDQIRAAINGFQKNE